MTALFKWLTAVFAVMLAGSLISMMAAFVGSEGRISRISSNCRRCSYL